MFRDCKNTYLACEFKILSESLTKKLCAISGKRYCLKTGNGTSAIYLALKASGIAKGSYIAVPNIACPDPVYALIWAGYKPYFIDVNMDDYNIDVEHFSRIAAKKNIKGLIAIHLFGNPCAIEKLRLICDLNSVFMVEDCAQAFGNTYNDLKLGSFGDVSIFSFGKGKIIEVGHGGSVQTNDVELHARICELSNDLPTYDDLVIDKLSKSHRDIYYKIFNISIKYPIVDILNLIFVYRFKKYYLYQLDDRYLGEIDEKVGHQEGCRTKRLNIVKNYQAQLQGRGIDFPLLYGSLNVLSRFTVSISHSERISEELRNAGIPSNTMYPPLAGRFYAFFNKKKLKNSYHLRGRLLNLWTNGIDENQLTRTISIIKKDLYE